MRNFIILAASIMLVTGVIITIQHSAAQPPATETEPTIWMYKVVQTRELAGDTRDANAIVQAVEKGLNDAGGKGWELCLEINGAIVFKRQK